MSEVRGMKGLGEFTSAVPPLCQRPDRELFEQHMHTRIKLIADLQSR
jgi:hypothetical protein